MRIFYTSTILAITAFSAAHTAAPITCPTLTVAQLTYDKAKLASDSGWKRTETLDFIGWGMATKAKQMQPLFQQLADPKCKTVKISREGSLTVIELSKPKANTDAADMFALWALPIDKMEAAMEAMWKEGPTGYRKMTLFAQGNATARNGTNAFVGRKVRDAWSTSNLSSGYEPMKGLIKARYEMANAITDDPELKKWEQQLIYDAVKLYDKYSMDAIPDHLYVYTKPTG